MNNLYHISKTGAVTLLREVSENRSAEKTTTTSGKLLVLDHEPTEQEISDAVASANLPKSLPSWRVEAVLKIAGKLESAMAFINALPEPQRTITQCAWAKNEQVERHGALLTAALPALSITGAEADAMFLQAAALVPN